MSSKDFRHLMIDVCIDMISILTLAFFSFESIMVFLFGIDSRLGAPRHWQKQLSWRPSLWDFSLQGALMWSAVCHHHCPSFLTQTMTHSLGAHAGHPFWHATIVYLDGGPWIQRAVAGMACVYCLLCSHTLSWFQRYKKQTLVHGSR